MKSWAVAWKDADDISIIFETTNKGMEKCW